MTTGGCAGRVTVGSAGAHTASPGNIGLFAKGDDAEDIKAKIDALNKSSMKLGEAMYKATQEQADSTSAGADAASGSTEDGVVDADVEEVDEDKKDK